MSASKDTARKWLCERCQMTVSRAHGEPTPLPEGWARSAEGDFCLSCRRERAGEAALETAPSDSNHDTRAKLRRAGLLEFEVRRAPDRPDSTIAKACHSSASAVAAAREAVRSGTR